MKWKWVYFKNKTLSGNIIQAVECKISEAGFRNGEQLISVQAKRKKTVCIQ